jgi:hypothetical protein
MALAQFAPCAAVSRYRYRVAAVGGVFVTPPAAGAVRESPWFDGSRVD